MNVKQAIKDYSLLGILVISISACSSSPEVVEEAPEPVPAPVEAEPVPIEEEEVISAVINNGVIDIPVIEDARVFAEFSDALPAVINYFTSASEDEVIEFYQQSFGEAISQERKRGRLTLHYTQAEEAMRVVISPQNNKRQVDVLIESKN